jgi:hypothetical protein
VCWNRPPQLLPVTNTPWTRHTYKQPQMVTTNLSNYSKQSRSVRFSEARHNTEELRPFPSPRPGSSCWGRSCALIGCLKVVNVYRLETLPRDLTAWRLCRRQAYMTALESRLGYLFVTPLVDRFACQSTTHHLHFQPSSPTEEASSSRQPARAY